MNKILLFIKNNVIGCALSVISLVFCIILFCVSCGYESDIKDRFVSPVANEMYSDNGWLGQKESMYIVSTYSGDKYTSALIGQLRKLEKEKDVAFYLFDVNTYGNEFLKAYNITSFPTYFFVQYSEEEGRNVLMYKSYGAKSYELLVQELEYCQLNGSQPINEVEETKTDAGSNLEITFKSIDTSDGVTSAVFTIKNTGDSSITFDTAYVTAKAYGSSTSAPKDMTDYTTSIKAKEEVEITFVFKKVEKNHIVITFNLTELQSETSNNKTITFTNNYLLA